MNRIICPLCSKSVDDRNFIELVENIWDSKKNVYECLNCGLYFIDKPSEKEIELLYKSNYYTGSKNILYEFIENRMKYSRALNRFSYIKSFINKDKYFSNILEIGASDGLLLSFFKKSGMNITGYELSENARKQARCKYSINMRKNFLEDLNSSENKYDVVIMSHVLEHFTDTKDKLKNIYSMIKKGGVIFIEVPFTPNRKFISKDDMKIFFETEHTVHFNEKNISLLMESSNFEIIDLKYHEYDVSETIKKNIWLGSLDSKSVIRFAFFISKVFFNPKKVFIDRRTNEKDNFSFGQNIRLIAKKL